ncbi:MAG TPA: pyridoxamine 5'-phosphate oxidase family protein [Gaiellaceae bacterium]|nr:pyridoxamine 5'-phosphate oxidase family protein [Gaiellaceae bacterium]
MRGEADPVATARAIVDGNLYMVLGTADERGRPWVSPVYYAHVHYREFLWVSRPETLHSRNLVARPQVSLVIFDSSVPISTGQGVYMAATSEEVTGDARLAMVDVFSRRSLGHGGGPLTLEDIEPPAELRLYRAVAAAHFILGSIDRLVAVDLLTVTHLEDRTRDAFPARPA